MISLLFALVLSAAPQFEVQPLEGAPVTGQLVGLDARQVIVEQPSGRVPLETQRIASITAKPKPVGGGEPGARVELVDGSLLLASEYTVREGKAKIAMAGGEVLELPTRQIAAVRFQAGREATTAEWSRIRAVKHAGDLLVTNKADSLDYHKGVIHEVGDKQVRFDLDGEVLEVKRSKIYGLIYYHAAAEVPPPAPYTIVDTSGSQWSANSLSLDGKLGWTTPGGQAIRRGLDQIVSIDLSRGKILYLSDLQPDSTSFTPFFATVKELPGRQEFFRPRRDQNLESKPLRINGQVFAKGLAMHSRTEMVYRLPGRFRRFEAVAGIDDEVRPRGHVRLVIRGDDKVLFDGPVTGADAARPVSVDVGGVRRLVILADFGDDLDVGDHLDLGNARLIQ